MTTTTADIDNIKNDSNVITPEKPKAEKPKKAISVNDVRDLMAELDDRQLIALVNGIYKTADTKTLQKHVETLREKLKADRLSKLSKEELAAIKLITDSKDLYDKFNKGIYKDYFTHQLAESITNSAIRDNFNYSKGLKKDDIEEMDFSGLLNMTKSRKAILMYSDDTFKKWQFWQGVKSHNLVLKKMLGTKKDFSDLEKGFEPLKYCGAMVALGTMTKKGFEKIQKRVLPDLTN